MAHGHGRFLRPGSVLRAPPAAAFILLGNLFCATAMAQNAPVTVSIDATAGRHPISPLIYGVNSATAAELRALNAPLNRSGGDDMSTYSYANNTENLAADWYFESYPQQGGATPGGELDAFIQLSKGAGAVPMVTVPLSGWVAKLGPNQAILPSYPVSKYGPQCQVDPYYPDFGNGQRTDCKTDITADPNDAYVPDGPANEAVWFNHLVSTWGTATSGGVPYYLMDNEASIWFVTHRDIRPVGVHASEYASSVLTMSATIKAIDPAALVVAPEEWGWLGYFYSGYDEQYNIINGGTTRPDRTNEENGMDYIPWLLTTWKAAGRPVDVLSVHFYPQGGEFTNDVTQATQLLRNRSTRQLWDPNYVSESWIAAPVYLIPRLRAWVTDYYYPDAPVAITEYNWGAEASINGATAQADILGIFGAQGLNMATRLGVPDPSTPTFKAMEIYRNYDGRNSGFGETSIAAVAPQPDDLSAFAAIRAKDGAMTVMVISKVLSGSTALTLSVAHFVPSGTAQVYRLTSANAITAMPSVKWLNGTLTDTLPAQSITLYVLPK